jgi:hypothetical protein
LSLLIRWTPQTRVCGRTEMLRSLI